MKRNTTFLGKEIPLFGRNLHTWGSKGVKIAEEFEDELLGSNFDLKCLQLFDPERKLGFFYGHYQRATETD